MQTTSPAPPPARQQRHLLYLLAMVQFTVIADFMTVSPIGPMLMSAFAIGPRELGLLVAAYTLSAAFAGLLGTMLADRFDRKRMLLFLYGGFVVASVASSLATTYGTLMAARSLSGLFAGVIGATILTIVSDLVPEERRGHATGIVMTAFAVATVAGVPMGLIVAARFGWHAPFVLLAAIALPVWITVWWRAPPVNAHLVQRRLAIERGERPSAGLGRLLEILRVPQHRVAYGLVVLVMTASFMVIPYISLHLVLNVGITVEELPIVYLAGGAATLLTARRIGRLADRHGKTRVFRVLVLVAIIPLMAITHLPPATVVWASLVSVLVFVLLSGRMVPMMAILTSVPETRNRGAFMSLNQTVQSVTQGVATWLSSLMLVPGPGGTMLHFDRVGWLAAASSVLAWYWVSRVKPVPRD